MEWSLVVFLGMSMVSLVVLMGIIIFGTRKTNEYKVLRKTLDKQAKEVDLDAKELLKVLKKSEEEKEKILERLQNLEAIVTSEAWESIQKRVRSRTYSASYRRKRIPEELKDADKAAKMAKRGEIRLYKKRFKHIPEPQYSFVI